MKKHSKEEKHDLNRDTIRIKIFFFILFFYAHLSAQIPLNGFCKLTEFSTKESLLSFFPIDYNSDGWRDLILFDQSNANYYSQSWANSTFSKPLLKNSGIAFTKFYPLGNNDGKGKKFGFISRKNRLAGIINFSKDGGSSILNRAKLNSYPSNIDAADIDGGGKTELLISGGSFEGLSIIKEAPKSLIEIKISPVGIYSYHTFIDLDYDSFPDIAAVDLFKNSIILFYNDGKGSFNESRSFGSESTIQKIKADDINSDGFTDLIYINNHSFQALLGDSVSSFYDKISITTEDIPEEYTILDFNADGYNDIAYIASGAAYVIFGRSNNTFYSPVLYHKKEGLVNITSFVDRGGRKLCLLDIKGSVSVIEKINPAEDEFTLSLSVQPSLVGTFDLYNDRTPDLYFIDKDKNNLVVLASEYKKPLVTYYSFSLFQVHKNIIVDETQSLEKTFYCYTRGEKNIELLRVKFKNGSYTRKVLYTNDPITDLKITSDRLKDRQTIFVLIQKNKKLFLQSFDFRDFRYINSGLSQIVDGAERSSLLLDLYKEIYFFTRPASSVILKQATFNRKITAVEQIAYYPVLSKFHIDLNCFDDKDINENVTVASFCKDDSTSLTLISNDKIKELSLNKFICKSGMTKYIDGVNRNAVTLYDELNGKLKRINFDKKMRNVEIEDIFESKNINSYIVTSFNNKNEYLVYTDTLKNQINFKQIK
ncbi:MAG: VCBS repeat-containing protein [Bacteroidota bacterium]